MHRRKRVLQAVIITAAVFMLLAAGGYIITRPENKTESTLAGVINADELIDAFQNDERAANEKYLDKLVCVQGRIKEVLKKEDVFVVLLGSTSALSNVSCTLSKQHEAVAYGLHTGDTIMLQGVCSGLLMDIILTDCKITD